MKSWANIFESNHAMKTLREVLYEAERQKVAVGHFNVSDLTTLKAAFEASRELNLPVMIGVSEGEREFIGVSQVAALIKSIRQDYDFPIFLNADHTRSLAKAQEAANAGFDSIVFDRSELPFADNVSETKGAVEAIRKVNPSIVVEGEIGFIGSGSEIHEKVPDASKILTTPEDARRFVKLTGVDVLAPAVGTMHGLVPSMIRGEAEKRLNIERIGEIKKATNVFMTLHGGSGTNDEDLLRAINAGITIIHINTEIRVAWRRGIETAFAEQPSEITPYKLFPKALEATKTVIRARLKLFSSSRETHEIVC
jgi:fructose-bisphosphate aldolase class II